MLIGEASCSSNETVPCPSASAWHPPRVGTPHKPPVISETGACVFEGVACADYLLAAGVAGDQLLKETASYDTIGNAYFSAMIHAWPRRWRRVAVVTSAFHMPRTRAIFDAVFRLVDAQAGGTCAPTACPCSCQKLAAACQPPAQEGCAHLR
jgi:uncharacterized SAM-binding protein YcdF (DUF218 family)